MSMASFAKIGSEGRVESVAIVANHVLLNSDRVEDPGRGEAHLKALFGGNWVQCSYNTQRGKHGLGGTPLRKNYPGVGWEYDSIRDAFVPPRPFPSWVLDEKTCCWEAPIPMPDNAGGKYYEWDEENVQWVEA